MSQGKQRAWWAKEEAPAGPPAPRFRGVAYYRHSAKDRQENSVAIQQELVQKWARENGIEIIQEFADRGKSGLTAEGRDGFNDMLENWVKKRNDFDFVLCLDVSRWGRFQDIDLSATYCAECKKHGKQVIYTTLGMPRPDDPLYPVYVQFERFRAAQQSKELSVKVYHGCIKIAQQGFWAGGKPPFGMDRLLLDETRKRLHVLAYGQKKSISNQRVTLTLGPETEVVTVRRMFHEFIDLGYTMQRISPSETLRLPGFSRTLMDTAVAPSLEDRLGVAGPVGDALGVLGGLFGRVGQAVRHATGAQAGRFQGAERAPDTDGPLLGLLDGLREA